jgi:putative transposase
MPTDSVHGSIQPFDPRQDLRIVERRLLHWSQAGTITFITFRTEDSVPADVLERWLAERCQFLRQHGIDPTNPDWRQQLDRLEPRLRDDFRRTSSVRWNDALDTCHGACVLRRPELSLIVAESLHHFDGTRYELTDFVVMPNHVHVLVAFLDDEALLKQCESWKHFTATQINRRLGQKGRFWQQDGFDHLVRTSEQFERFRRYIADNPRRARLRAGEFVLYSKPLA